MWLINIYTLELEEFFGDKTPPYAILSHTWDKGELTFQDWQRIDDQRWGALKKRQGYSKIINTCNFVKKLKSEKLLYVWIDTVCIDKRSSAELSEAINSMFEWYKSSQVCLVYMADVSVPRPFPGRECSDEYGIEDSILDFDSGSVLDFDPDSVLDFDPDSGHYVYKPSAKSREDLPDLIQEQFLGSRWFTRGWTLQELLAPRFLIYISEEWNIIGNHFRLTHFVSKASGIPQEFLLGSESKPLTDTSVADRMHWASGRITTRLEDTAYCLMGIFNVNMPLLYGEGPKAFRRLQMEIIKESNDHSLLTWDPDGKGSFFAPSPQAFSRNSFSNFVQHQSFNESSLGYFIIERKLGRTRPFAQPKPYYMTNFGLRITLPLLRTADTRLSLGVLNLMATESFQGNEFLCLILIQVPTRVNQWFSYGVIPVMIPTAVELELYDQDLYLDSLGHAFVPEFGLLTRSLTHLTGQKCLFTYVWEKHNNVTAEVVVDDTGSWIATPMPWGVLTLHEVGDLQVLIIQIKDDQEQEIWYAVVYHPDYDWFIWSLGRTTPREESYDELAQKIMQRLPPSTSENRREEFLHVLDDMMHGKHGDEYIFRINHTSWPPLFSQHGQDYPVLFLEIS